MNTQQATEIKQKLDLELALPGRRDDADGCVNTDAEVPAGDFYVTVRDAGQTGFLLGPFNDHRDALANVRRGRDLACAGNSHAWFYTFGTSRLPIGTSCRTVFGI